MLKRIVLFVLLGLLASNVALAAPPAQDIQSFDVFLQGASGPMIAGIVAIALSIIAEYVPQFESLTSKWKRVVFFALCMIVPVLAATLRGAFGYVAWSWDPLYWHAIVYGAAAFGAGTALHTRKLPG